MQHCASPTTYANNNLTMDVRLGCPFTMLVSGASGSGKSSFTRKLLSSGDLLVSAPSRVVWCYGVPDAIGGNGDSAWRTLMESRGTSVEYHHGLHSEELLSNGNMVCIIDDLMCEAKSSGIVSDIFTKYSHHNNITCICLLQNLFPKGSQMRNISLNSNYIVMMKNSRDRAQINHLARQMYPGKSTFLTAAYEDATKREAYSYLLLDFKNTTPDQLRVRSGIFPGEAMCVYNPK